MRVEDELVTGARDRRVTGFETPVVLLAVAGAGVLEVAADAAAWERRVIGAIMGVTWNKGT